MKLNIAVLDGDGIGPEIVKATIKVLKKIASIYGHSVSFFPYLIGGAAIDNAGVPFPQETAEGCLSADAVLLGAVGGPKWDSLKGKLRPESALLELRKTMGVYTNLRPAKLFKPLADRCPLKNVAAFDILIVRELIGGIYFGSKGRTVTDGVCAAFDTELYSVPEIERIARAGFEAAQKRRGLLTSVDKANVLESSALWRETLNRLSTEYPDVTLRHMLVDNAAMQLIRNPDDFDVIVTSNMFGDILSDEAAQLTGSIGLLPSASLGNGSAGIYEAIHGSAPDIAGKGIANPVAEILSAALMLRYSFDLPDEADAIESAVLAVLSSGAGTPDIADEANSLGTDEFTELIIKEIISSGAKRGSFQEKL